MRRAEDLVEEGGRVLLSSNGGGNQRALFDIAGIARIKSATSRGSWNGR